MSSDRTLVYIADPMCSWCWGFAPVIDELVTEFADRLSLRMVAGGLRPYTKEAMDDEMREEILHHWQSVHEMTGQPFTFDDAFPAGFLYDTEPACRAVVTARKLAGDQTALRLLRSLHEGFYVKQRDVTQPEVLAELAGSLDGLDGDVFAGQLDTDAARDRTLDDFRFSYSLGVRGFPTVVLEHKERYGLLSSGYQPIERLKPGIEAWLAADE